MKEAHPYEEPAYDAWRLAAVQQQWLLILVAKQAPRDIE